MTRQKIGQITKDEITMFDAVNQFAGQLPADTKKTLSQVFLFLLACTEDKTLNMDRVASMMSKLTDGEMRFDLPE